MKFFMVVLVFGYIQVLVRWDMTGRLASYELFA